MEAKITMVTLVCATLNNVTQDFEFSHAERLLRMRNNGGWQLPTDSKYEFVNNGIRFKQDTKGDNGTQQKGSDKSGKGTSKQD